MEKEPNPPFAVEIIDTEPTEVEKLMREDRQFAPEERLACQLEPHDGLIIEVPESHRNDL